jgi:hypothetical protein
VLVDELRTAGDTVGTFRLYPSSGTMSYDSARVLIRSYPRAVFAVSVRPIAWRGHVALPDSLARLILWADTTRAMVLASFGSPYLLHQLPGYRSTYLLAWSDASATERAVARALALGAPMNGHLPVTLSPEHPRGFGIDVPERRP